MFSSFQRESNTASLYSRSATCLPEMDFHPDGNFQSATGLEFGIPAAQANSLQVQTMRALFHPTTHLLPHAFFDASPTVDGHCSTHDYHPQGDPFQTCTGKADMWPRMQFTQAAIDYCMESAPRIQGNSSALINHSDVQERTVVCPTAAHLVESRDPPKAKPCRVRQRAPHDGALGICMWDGGCQRFLMEGTNGDLLNHLMTYHDEVGLTGGKRLHCRWEGCKGIRHSNDGQVSAANLRRHISSAGHVSRLS